jgi:hypothetical protein
MKITTERITKMIFSSIYSLYLNRLERNGRTEGKITPIDIVANWF